MDYEAVAPVLRSVALSAAAREPLDPLSVANELGRELEHVLDQLHQLEATGLMLPGEDQNASTPILMHAGSQYLAAEGRFSHEQLRFLPVVIDDLHTRGALLAAGTRLVDEFRSALLRREAVTHARDLVPAAFVPAVHGAGYTSSTDMTCSAQARGLDLRAMNGRTKRRVLPNLMPRLCPVARAVPALQRRKPL